MRALLASVAVLFSLAGSAAAEGPVRGYLTSISSGTFLCAAEQGVTLGICPPTAMRLRFYAIERSDAHTLSEIQLAATGACLTVEGTPAPGARVTTAPCGRQLWRFDLERLRVTLAGLCLEPGEAAPGEPARPVLALCAGDADRTLRQEWAIALERSVETD